MRTTYISANDESTNRRAAAAAAAAAAQQQAAAEPGGGELSREGQIREIEVQIRLPVCLSAWVFRLQQPRLAAAETAPLNTPLVSPPALPPPPRQASFAAAQQPIVGHPCKRGVVATEVLPMLPDLERWPHKYIQVGGGGGADRGGSCFLVAVLRERGAACSAQGELFLALSPSYAYISRHRALGPVFPGIV
jgi:hypothetical protein